MHRFYSPHPSIQNNKITIDDPSQVHHIKDVLYLKPEDTLMIFDREGREYLVEIEKMLPQSVVSKIKNKSLPEKDNGSRLTIACAIPKKNMMDDIVDKLTQLGVQKIIPMDTERVVVKLDRQKKILRQRRWEKIAVSASEQSQRNKLAIVEAVTGFKDVLTQACGYDLKLIPTLSGERKSLKDSLEGFRNKNILVMIGPEGDFSACELKLAKKSGFVPITLGDLVLRVDTAAMAVASFVKLYGCD